MNLLIVEDDALTADSMEHLFVEAGYTVKKAATAETALDALHYWNADVILTDLIMPGMGGQGFLKALEGMGRHAPVVVLTARGEEETAHLPADSVFRILRKPTPPEQIIRAVEKAAGVVLAS